MWHGGIVFHLPLVAKRCHLLAASIFGKDVIFAKYNPVRVRLDSDCPDEHRGLTEGMIV